MQGKFHKFSQDAGKFYEFLQDAGKFYEFSQDAGKFYEFLQDAGKSYKFLQDAGKFLQNFPCRVPEVSKLYQKLSMRACLHMKNFPAISTREGYQRERQQ